MPTTASTTRWTASFVVGDTASRLGEMHADIIASGADKTLHNASLAVRTRTDAGRRLLTHESTVIPS